MRNSGEGGPLGGVGRFAMPGAERSPSAGGAGTWGNGKQRAPALYGMLQHNFQRSLIDLWPYLESISILTPFLYVVAKYAVC